MTSYWADLFVKGRKVVVMLQGGTEISGKVKDLGEDFVVIEQIRSTHYIPFEQIVMLTNRSERL